MVTKVSGPQLRESLAGPHLERAMEQRENNVSSKPISHNYRDSNIASW